jgi:hypothetical protein
MLPLLLVSLPLLVLELVLPPSALPALLSPLELLPLLLPVLSPPLLLLLVLLSLLLPPLLLLPLLLPLSCLSLVNHTAVAAALVTISVVVLELEMGEVQPLLAVAVTITGVITIIK